MVRSYTCTTDRAGSDRMVRVRFERRDEIDVEKIAEVLIRLALRAPDDHPSAETGDYLRQLLSPRR